MSRRHRRSRSRSRSRDRDRDHDRRRDRDKRPPSQERYKPRETKLVKQDPSAAAAAAEAAAKAAEDAEYERRIAQKLEEEEREKKRLETVAETRKRRAEMMANASAVALAPEQPKAAALPPPSPPPPQPSAAVVVPPPPPAPAATPAVEEDVFDMFGDADAPSVPVGNNAQLASTEIQTDAEGYGSITAGRILGGRYKVAGEAGKGVFSTVLRCTDLQTNSDVIVKVARMNEAMKRAGRKEIEYLKLLTKKDPENKYCTLRMLDSFEDQDFLCIVLEALDISLRETVYLYGQGEGLSLAAVRYYGKRVLMGLYHMKQCGLVHTDLKLDNLLIDKSRKVLKLADFGSTCRVSEFVKGRTEQLCPLWYRPPEVIVGLPYMSYSLDIWCFGNILFELATGTVLFQGNNLSEQLRMYIEMLGPLPKKMVRENAEAYFANGDPTKFLHMQTDPVTGRPIVSILDMTNQPTLSLKERILDFFAEATAEERKHVLLLHNCIEKCLTLNPRKRITVEELLQHPFFADEEKKKT